MSHLPILLLQTHHQIPQNHHPPLLFLPRNHQNRPQILLLPRRPRPLLVRRRRRHLLLDGRNGRASRAQREIYNQTQMLAILALVNSNTPRVLLLLMTHLFLPRTDWVILPQHLEFSK
jgi:hypothetical protein